MKYQNKRDFDAANMFGLRLPNNDFAQYFNGSSFLKPPIDSQSTNLSMFNVTFATGCRNNWHIHHAKKGGGQILICTADEWWHQVEGKEVQELK
ncbi:Uncharacterised protein [Metamycoplasma arthritidis]|uniref:Cupin n=2 Tax=Metamycoplasma arthritidis TaxID=2111 RepID=B3PLY3_META1|nr:cupin [Metamycoplasma arthritidis]ACF07035.1 conserved hypothetical protein [Metamycoplasma arthritidis 158L3-1]VEU78563.1 Uncharacterised protein [Metamycoplasma arthritidis]